MKKNIRKTFVGLIFIILTLQMHITALAAPNIPAATSDFSLFTIDWDILGLIILVASIIGVIIAIGFIIYKSKKIKNLEKENKELRSNIKSVKIDAAEKIKQVEEKASKAHHQYLLLRKEFSSLRSRFNSLEDRYKRGTILFPALDAKVDAMIEEEIRKNDMAQAAEVVSLIYEVLLLPAKKEYLEKFQKTLNAYNSLTPKQRTYVRADINKVRNLYETSSTLSSSK